MSNDKKIYIEDRISQLEEEVRYLRERVTYLETTAAARFVTPKELAEIMNCSVNTIYSKIRQGIIQATRLTGSPRIPMSQFYNNGVIAPEKTLTVRNNSPKKLLGMKELIFGDDL